MSLFPNRATLVDRAILAALFLATAAPAQQPGIQTYIHQSWDSLSRSMVDCASFADTKLNSTPVLYLPAEEPIPAAVKAMQQRCKVDVRHLPRSIHREGELSPDAIPTPGLLYLPNPYVVPGGRFNEMYGWDSYFIILGELDDNRIALAHGTVENFFYEIDHYGSVLNANRTYYLTRSQPPFLSSMVIAVFRAINKTQPTKARAFLRQALPYLARDHALWTAAPHLDPASGLSRYFDLGHGPVPEMADDSAYYSDVIAWLRAHPRQTPLTYLKAADSDVPCMATLPRPCLDLPHDGPYELTENFYAGDRAMRESGFDTSFRFGPFSGDTHHFLPVCLNSLLYKYERDIAFIQTTLGQAPSAAHWNRLADARRRSMNALMWNDLGGLFLDYDLSKSQRSPYLYITTFYPLWTGLATPAQALRLAANLKLFEHPGGLAMSTEPTGTQWDAPFGWAPTNWITIHGLHRYGFEADARRLAREFSTTIENNFAHDGTIREKYNVESADANVAVAAGYKANVIGFGWTNGVYLQMQRVLAEPATPAN